MRRTILLAASALLVAAGVLAPPVAAQAPVPTALLEARTVYLVNAGAGQGTFDGLADELRKWGRWELVSDAAAADLTVTIGGFVTFKGWPLTITTTDGQVPVWSDHGKRGLATSVSENLVKNLRKRLDGAKPKGKAATPGAETYYVYGRSSHRG